MGFFQERTTQPERGFTLIETVVALVLIVSAMTGPFTLATRGILAAKTSKNKLTALNLGQEGIELIRHMRENNVANNYDWRGSRCTPGTSAGCTDLRDGTYQPDVFTDARGATPPLNSDSPLRFDNASGLYNQSSGLQTEFTRVVTITTPGANRMHVVATVAWDESGIHRQALLEEDLYNWQ